MTRYPAPYLLDVPQKDLPHRGDDVLNVLVGQAGGQGKRDRPLRQAPRNREVVRREVEAIAIPGMKVQGDEVDPGSDPLSFELLDDPVARDAQPSGVEHQR